MENFGFIEIFLGLYGILYIIKIIICLSSLPLAIRLTSIRQAGVAWSWSWAFIITVLLFATTFIFLLPELYVQRFRFFLAYDPEHIAAQVNEALSD